MGIASESPFLVSLPLRVLHEEAEVENKNSSYGHLWRKKIPATKARKQLVMTQKSVKKPRRVLMKRRVRLMEGSGRRGNGIQRRLRTLKRLIPNSECMGLDGLFRETADYILSLQMRVRVMQTMVKVLSGSDE